MGTENDARAIVRPAIASLIRQLEVDVAIWAHIRPLLKNASDLDARGVRLPLEDQPVLVTTSDRLVDRARY